MGESTRQARGVPARGPGQPHPRHGRRRRPDEGLREVVDEEKAEEDAIRMLKGEFTLDDFLEQIR
jgi:hypothetical protein